MFLVKIEAVLLKLLVSKATRFEHEPFPWRFGRLMPIEMARSNTVSSCVGCSPIAVVRPEDYPKIQTTLLKTNLAMGRSTT